jgi:ABC-type sugar transport system substrate-binding protein
LVKIWPIASAAVTATLLLGAALAAGPEANQERVVRARPAAKELAVRAGSDPVRIGVVLNYLDDPFFVAIYEGVRAEASRLGVRVTVRSVTSNAEFADQAAQLRELAGERHDCYVVNPITASNLVPALRGITRPIVNVDSPVDTVAAKRAGVRIRTYIGTDDFASGSLAGDRMAAILPDGGEVALLGGIADNINSGRRLSGFEHGIQGSRVKVVARVNADYNRTKAQIAAARIIRTHPRLSAFFAVSDSMVLGVADALRGAGKTGKIKVIGHDGNAAALAQIRDGSISADVSQYPYVIGQMAVEACVAAARGARVPARVHAPVALISQGNVERAVATFPKPFQPYADPFRRLIRTRP